MTTTETRAIVFAYHNVGVRGLAVLLANNVDVALVVTHDDNPAENIWFQSVADLAALNNIPVIRPADPNVPAVLEQVRVLEPQLIFSFYYRHMLSEPLLQSAKRGAYNLHGSLLPKYRGRVPVNWAVLHGESETGASLHRMAVKPDAGPLVDQLAVPILPNDTSHDVFQKVTWAAEQVLYRSVPKLLTGTATETALDLSQGSYFGGRRPEDGRIPWNEPAWRVHNLIRAVAPPYPGAFFDAGDKRVQVLGSYYRGEKASGSHRRMYWQDGQCWADCSDGQRLHITALAVDGELLNQAAFRRQFGKVDLDLA